MQIIVSVLHVVLQRISAIPHGRITFCPSHSSRPSHRPSRPSPAAESREGHRPASVSASKMASPSTPMEPLPESRPPSRSSSRPSSGRRKHTPREPPNTRWRSLVECFWPCFYSCSVRWSRWPRWNRLRTTQPRPVRSAHYESWTWPWCRTRARSRWRSLSRKRAPRPRRWRCPRPFPERMSE
jgi:hypothetical protein